MSSSSHRPGIQLAASTGASALIAFSAPGFAQDAPPSADCMETETQAECHERLNCRADEDLEECKKRLREGKGEGGDRDDDDARDRRDRDDDDRRDRRDRDDDDDDDDDDHDDDHDDDRDDDDDDDDDRDRRRGRGGDDVLRPGTHPGFLTGAVGPSFLICYRSDCDPPGDIVQFYGALDFGWHLTGEGFEGPAIGANLHGGYGRVRGWDTGRFGAAFKFWWDIQPDDDLGLYLTPTAQAGHTSFFFETNRLCYIDPVANRRVCPNVADDEHFFNLQIGMAVRLVLNDLGMLYFQPITLDTVFNGNGAGLLWRLELGGGVIFGD